MSGPGDPSRPDQPVAGVPAWRADPSGRHQYRWWDGEGYTDQVADDGVTTTDPGPVVAEEPPPPEVAPVPLPDTPSPAVDQPVLEPLSPTFGAGAAPVPAKTRKAPLLLAVVLAAVAAGAVAYFVLLDDDATSSGTGTFEGTIDDDHPAGVHAVELSAGSALTVELDPDSDLDAVVGLVVSRDDAERIEDLYDDIGELDVRDPDDAFDAIDVDDIEGLSASDQVLFRTDVGFAGDREIVLLAVPFDIDVQVVVAPFETDEFGAGDYEITIDAVELDVDDDADIEDLLDAVDESDDIDDDVKDLAEEQLGS